jgi:hypothetical protein
MQNLICDTSRMWIKHMQISFAIHQECESSTCKSHLWYIKNVIQAHAKSHLWYIENGNQAHANLLFLLHQECESRTCKSHLWYIENANQSTCKAHLFASRAVEDLLRTTARIQYSFQCPVQIIGVECERKKRTHARTHTHTAREREREKICSHSSHIWQGKIEHMTKRALRRKLWKALWHP